MKTRISRSPAPRERLFDPGARMWCPRCGADVKVAAIAAREASWWEFWQAPMSRRVRIVKREEFFQPGLGPTDSAIEERGLFVRGHTTGCGICGTTRGPGPPPTPLSDAELLAMLAEVKR